jgi:hypothetical protein
MDYSEQLEAAAGARYVFPVDPRRLAVLRDGLHGKPLELAPLRTLARDVLAGRHIGTDHPYFRESFAAHVAGGWVESWESMIQRKVAAIHSIASRGVREPVAAFFDERGLMYFHGYHRLAAALELGLPTIPLAAHVMPGALAELAAWAFGQYEEPLRFSAYQPIPHPLFELVPVQSANAAWAERTAAVLGAMDGWTGRKVEVGAHLGMLTRALRRAGHYAEAIDADPQYKAAQPWLKAIGCEAVPYETASLEELAGGSECTIICLGLWHHLMGQPDAWERLRDKVLPWMRRCVSRAIVEVSLSPLNEGGPAAMPLGSDADAVRFWAAEGYDAERICDGAWDRAVYSLRWVL